MSLTHPLWMVLLDPAYFILNPMSAGWRALLEESAVLSSIWQADCRGLPHLACWPSPVHHLLPGICCRQHGAQLVCRLVDHGLGAGVDEHDQANQANDRCRQQGHPEASAPWPIFPPLSCFAAACTTSTAPVCSHLEKGKEREVWFLQFAMNNDKPAPSRQAYDAEFCVSVVLHQHMEIKMAC